MLAQRRRSLLFSLGFFASVSSALASPHAPLRYHGGPILTSFTIYPLYYGNWSRADIAKSQQFLTHLTDYISGVNSLPYQQPVIRQYGVLEAAVAAPAVAVSGVPPGPIPDGALRDIIHANQLSWNLPAYDGHTLIMVFPSAGFFAPLSQGCAYHGSETAAGFYAIVPFNCNRSSPQDDQGWFDVVGHEVFEAAANPGITVASGWDEAMDGCVTGFRLPPWELLGGAADNTQDGWCSSTGYVPAAPPNQEYVYI